MAMVAVAVTREAAAAAVAHLAAKAWTCQRSIPVGMSQHQTRRHESTYRSGTYSSLRGLEHRCK